MGSIRPVYGISKAFDVWKSSALGLSFSLSFDPWLGAGHSSSAHSFLSQIFSRVPPMNLSLIKSLISGCRIPQRTKIKLLVILFHPVGICNNNNNNLNISVSETGLYPLVTVIN